MIYFVRVVHNVILLFLEGKYIFISFFKKAINCTERVDMLVWAPPQTHNYIFEI